VAPTPVKNWVRFGFVFLRQHGTIFTLIVDLESVRNFTNWVLLAKILFPIVKIPSEIGENLEF
jgi:hypothetical protein